MGFVRFLDMTLHIQHPNSMTNKVTPAILISVTTLSPHMQIFIK